MHSWRIRVRLVKGAVHAELAHGILRTYTGYHAELAHQSSHAQTRYKTS
jgi:hypothetical protein